jgi:hypothetical protein
MPYDDPDPTDPMTLHGVLMDDGEPPSVDAVLDMAECFVEEFARMGFDANRILHLFDTKGYAGPAMAAEILGKKRVRELVDTVLARWKDRGGESSVIGEGPGRLSLAVLNT